MQLVIEDKVYDLIEIPYDTYVQYTYKETMPEPHKYFSELEPDDNFDYMHYANFETTYYKSIKINSKFYYPKLVENVV